MGWGLISPFSSGKSMLRKNSEASRSMPWQILKLRLAASILEKENRFPRTGVTQFFSDQAFDRFRISSQGINRDFEPISLSFFRLDLTFEFENLFSHPFVLLD